MIRLTQVLAEENKIEEAKDPIKDMFGLDKKEFDATIQAAKRKGYKPSSNIIAKIQSKYPKLKEKEAVVLAMLFNSGVMNTFGTYDIMSYLKKGGF
jgi:hypothetical protein